MTQTEQYISDAIAHHLFDIDHTSYNELLTILDLTTLIQLSNHLENNEDEKFKEALKEILKDREINKQITQLITYQRAQQPTLRTVTRTNPVKSTAYTIFYGTNREANDPNDPSKGYGNGRATKISVGACTVSIPKSREKGKIHGSFWEKLMKLDFSHGDLQLQKINPLASDDFWSQINELLNLNEGEQQALVFIHGYNTSFEGAAIRAAQISADLQHPLLTAFFSWPSRGSLFGYLSDEAAIQYSEKYISEFLVDFVKNSTAKRVHIIAHSMGNRGLIEAINNIQRNHTDINFGQIILAAPDVDADVFKEKAVAYEEKSEHTTLYVSSQDKAVGASKWVHSYPRAGFTPPINVVQNIDTVEVDSEVDLLELGHGYFASHQSLLDDIETLFRFNIHAQDRKNLVHTLTDNYQTYWRLKI